MATSSDGGAPTPAVHDKPKRRRRRRSGRRANDGMPATTPADA
jgi:hypothetical protein